MKTAIWAALAIMICTAALCGAEEDDVAMNSAGSLAIIDADPVGNSLNDSQFLKLMDRVWMEYTEDFVYTSGILDRYVHGNITAERAMTATMSIYLLNSKTMSALQGIEPEEKYANYYDITVQTLTTFQDYLWSLGKYYETTDPKYAALSSDSYNLTSSYAQKGLEEAMFV